MPRTLDSVPAAAAAAAAGGVQTGSGKPHLGRSTPSEHSLAAVQAAVEQIRANLASPARRLEFHVEPLTAEVTVAIRDALTGEEIHRIAGSALLNFADVLMARHDAPRGLLDLTA